jgi:DNA mismatch endonuclease, patch repair protein
MADIVSPVVRSRMMSGIRGANTMPEQAVRRILHSLGYRFRLQKSSLTGRPDIVLRKHRIAVFVHGCFWHRHRGCNNSNLPASNPAFWREKLSRNVARDIRNERALLDAGWRVLTVWECAVRRGKGDADQLTSWIQAWAASNRRRGEVPRLVRRPK